MHITFSESSFLLLLFFNHKIEIIFQINQNSYQNFDAIFIAHYYMYIYIRMIFIYAFIIKTTKLLYHHILFFHMLSLKRTFNNIYHK